MRFEVQFERPVPLKAAGNASALLVRWDGHELWLNSVPTGGADTMAAAFVGGPHDLQSLLLRAALFVAVTRAPVLGWSVDGRAVDVVFNDGVAMVRFVEAIH